MTCCRETALCLILTLGACYSHRPATTALQASQPVRVTYSRPQSVTVMVGSETAPIQDVLQLSGHVQRESGDTLWLSVPKAIIAGGRANRIPAEATALVVRDANTKVETSHPSPGKTLAVVVTVAAVVYFIFASIAVDNLGSGGTYLLRRY